MARWNLQATYKLVGGWFGKAQMLLARESARSLVDRQNYAGYHYREVLRLTKAFERRHIKDGMLPGHLHAARSEDAGGFRGRDR